MRFLAFSDCHIHNYPQFAEPTQEAGISTRALWGLRCLESVRQIGESLRVDAYLFGGDLVYERYKLEIPLLLRLADELAKFPLIICNVGNHDMTERARAQANAVRVVSRMVGGDRMPVLDDGRVYKAGDDAVVGTPWGQPLAWPPFGRYEGPGVQIALTHEVIEGCRSETDFKLDARVSMSIVKNFMQESGTTLVLNGHVHRPQRLSRDVFCLGSPMHHRASDVDKPNRVFFVDTGKREYRWIPVSGTPRYRIVRFPVTEPLDPKDYHLAEIHRDEDLAQVEKLQGLKYKILDRRAVDGPATAPADLKRGFDPEEAVRAYVKARGWSERVAKRCLSVLTEVGG